MAIERKTKSWKKLPSEIVAEVVAAKISNPDLSTRDLAKKTGIGKSSTARILDNDLGQAGAIAKKVWLLETNLEIINEASKKVAKAMRDMNPADIREAKEMQSIVDTAFKQNQLIQGDPTENVSVKVPQVTITVVNADRPESVPGIPS